MSLRFIDGFDHYATADFLKKWTSMSNYTIDTGFSRHGGSSARAGQNGTMSKTLDNQATWVFGGAFYFDVTPNNTEMILLRDAGSTQATLRLNSDLTVSVTRNGTVLSPTASVNSFSLNTWYFIEWKVTIANSIGAGSCVVRVNGVDWLTINTGQDTQNTANAFANAFVIQSGVTTRFWLDDLYVLDGQGTMNNFLGDSRIVTVFPNNAGDLTQWTPSTGSNYQCVDEAQMNNDTDYVSSATPGQVDLYQLGNVTGSGTIRGVQLNIAARKDDAGARSIRRVLKTNGSTYNGSNISLADNYLFYTEPIENNPDTAAAWTVSDINSLQAGVELVS